MGPFWRARPILFAGFYSLGDDFGLAPADFEIGPASVVHPDAVTVISPSLAVDAIRVTALANQSHASAGIHVANFPVHVIRGAIDGRHSATARIPATFSPDLKIGSAAPVHPDAPLIEAPGAAIIARRAAALAHQLNSASRIRCTPILPAIIGRTVNVVAVVPSFPVAAAPAVISVPVPIPVSAPASADLEIGSAAAVHPDAPIVVPPRLALDAGGIAFLPDHLNSAARIRRANMPAHVIGITAHHPPLRRSRSSRCGSRGAASENKTKP